MGKNERAPLWAWGAILTLLVLVLVGWGELYAQRQARPEGVPLYGTFGTCRTVDLATYLTFDGDLGWPGCGLRSGGQGGLPLPLRRRRPAAHPVRTV